MKFISLFSGVEAASLALEPLGWEPVCYSEIDPFACSVLAHRWPNVPNLGSICDVDWSKYRGAADVTIGGFPCQSYSVAGLRNGLDDPRGQLMLEFLRACREIDSEWIVGENVPGLLSSHGGRDFETFLNAVAILWPRGGCSWRVLDAQWFGVPQRRRRLFIVINTRDWRRAAAVLSEPESVLWDLTPSREKREALASNAARSVGGGNLAGGRVTEPLSFKWWQGADARSIAAYDDGTTSTLTNSDGHQAAIVRESDEFPMGNVFAVRTANTGANGIGVQQECAHTLDTTGPEAVCFAQNQRDEVRLIGGDRQVAGALSASRFGTHKQETLLCIASGQANAEIEQGVSPTLTVLHEVPIVVRQQATGLASSKLSVQSTEASSSSTTSRSMEADSSSTTFSCLDNGAGGGGHQSTIVIDRAAFNQGANALYAPHIEETDVMDTLVARGPHAVSYSLRTDRM